MENKIKLEELQNDFNNFPNIPGQLFEYIKNVIKRNIQERFLLSLRSPLRKTILEKIDRKFKKASAILNLSPPEIVKALDFQPNDTGNGKIDAFFAELRIIFWLYYKEFKNIIPLKTKSKKRADFYAELDSFKCVIEVFCMIQKVHRWPDHKSKSHDLIQYYTDRAKEKKEQMDNTAKEFSCDKRILTLVLDSETAMALLRPNEYLEIVKRVSNSLNWGKNYHFALITGMETNGVLDDAVYPDIKQQLSTVYIQK